MVHRSVARRVGLAEIFRRRFRVMASQVGISDIEIGPYPDNWISGEELAISNSRGVAVSAPGDEEIELAVFEGDDDPPGSLIFVAEIDVGSEGLHIGTVFKFEDLPWPSGPTIVKVYVDGPRERPSQISFLLTRLK